MAKKQSKYADLWDRMRWQAEYLVQIGHDDTLVHVSADTKYGINKLYEYIHKYIADNKIDYEIGVLSKEAYAFYRKAEAILVNSMVQHEVKQGRIIC